MSPGQTFPEWPGQTFHAAQEYSEISVLGLFPQHGQGRHPMQHKSFSTVCFRKEHMLDHAFSTAQNSMQPRIFWNRCLRDLLKVLPQCGQAGHLVQPPCRFITCSGFHKKRSLLNQFTHSMLPRRNLCVSERTVTPNVARPGIPCMNF